MSVYTRVDIWIQLTTPTVFEEQSRIANMRDGKRKTRDACYEQDIQKRKEKRVCDTSTDGHCTESDDTNSDDPRAHQSGMINGGASGWMYLRGAGVVHTGWCCDCQDYLTHRKDHCWDRGYQKALEDERKSWQELLSFKTKTELEGWQEAARWKHELESARNTVQSLQEQVHRATQEIENLRKDVEELEAQVVQQVREDFYSYLTEPHGLFDKTGFEGEQRIQ